jgi:hypothetical protein
MTLLVTMLLAVIGAGEILAFQFDRIGAQALVRGAHVGAGLALFALVAVIAIAVLI